MNFSNWKFYCQSCGISGDIFNAAALLEEKPIAGHEFLEDNVLYLAEKMKVGEVRIRQLTERERLEVSMYQCMRAAVDVLKDITPQGRNDMDWHVRKYIYDHGWIIDESTPQVGTGTNPGTLNHMGVFWIPSGDLFRERLLALGYTEQFLDRMDLWKRGRDEVLLPTPVLKRGPNTAPSNRTGRWLSRLKKEEPMSFARWCLRCLRWTGSSILP